MSVTTDEDGSRLHDTGREPLVSVVIPAYNAADTLDTAVHSILRQSLSNLEILIVDDGSTDDTVAVAARLACRDSRIIVLRQPCNRGQAAARNVALDKARGRWIALVDADDEITEHRLHTLCEAGQAQQADLIADGVEFAGPRRPGTPARLHATEGLNGVMDTLSIEALIRSDIPLNGLCSFGYLKPLIRREFLEHWRLRYDEELRFAEDLNFFARALMCGGRFVLHPRTYYIYNQTPISASRNLHELPRSVDDVLVNCRRMRALARHHHLSALDALLDELEQRWSTVLWVNRLKLALRNGRIADVMQLTLDWPSGPRGMLRYARDRARVKRSHENGFGG
jgi:glycosyltransferase involved in cell wall biosynthesis